VIQRVLPMRKAKFVFIRQALALKLEWIHRLIFNNHKHLGASRKYRKCLRPAESGWHNRVQKNINFFLAFGRWMMLICVTQ